MAGRLIAVAATLIGGVSSAADCPYTHMNVVHHDAALALGAEYAPRLSYLPLSESHEVGIDRLCRLISKAIADSAGKPDQWAMGSEDGESAILVLRCVAATIGPRTLPDLDFVFVSDPAQAQEAQAIVERWGAKYYFVRDRGKEVDPAQLFPERQCTPR